MTRPRMRCAVYTRKSTDEGLEQAFNSLDAQREACEAFIRSQRHEGWQLIDEAFDDGGFSGGTMERPALQRLLAEIRAGRVEIVVVYKVDRLTRALSDFARMVETFDASRVSFVSVTQQFNTTSSMGRLTLNVLLSFAQFEREVTGERIRDKIAASKKKGMWMGGLVPLGYDAKDRSLVINEAEAETVRALFRLYLEHGCVAKVQVEAARAGLVTKSGRDFAAGHLYRVLQNPLYVGEIRHRHERYPGLHQAIIDRETWDVVQAKLADHRMARIDGIHAREPSLLAGRLFDDRGQPFTPSHAVKQGRRYRYYIERGPLTGAMPGRRPRRKRIAANEIEALVIDAVARLLRSPKALSEAAHLSHHSADGTKTVMEVGADLATGLKDDPRQRHVIIRALVARVTLSEGAVRTDLSSAALRRALEIEEVGLIDEPYTITVPARLRARGLELRFVIDGPDSERLPAPDPSLIKAIVRAHDWFQRLLTGEASTLADIAKAEGMNNRYVRRIIQLASLAPDITAAILDGHQPIDLTAERLTNILVLPVDWAEQRKLLGFA